MGNSQSLICASCTSHLRRLQRGPNCAICKRVHCSNCSNREKLKLEPNANASTHRVCHACSISIGNNENSKPIQ